MEASHKTHLLHIKVGKDAEEEEDARKACGYVDRQCFVCVKH